MCLCTNQANHRASLASSPESETGGINPPPRKKRRLPISCFANSSKAAWDNPALAAAMHQVNGSSSAQNGASVSNGDCSSDAAKNDEPLNLSNRDKDVVRLIGQYLRSLGLE